MISGNMVGSYSQMGKTFILVDENGAELTGVVVDQETIFTATDNQVYSGFVYAGDSGVSTGTREFISYRTAQGVQLIAPGSNYTIPLSAYNRYDYTKFQCIITKYTSNSTDRMAAEKISLNDNVYEANSSVALSSITKNAETKSIDLNITNDTVDFYMIYFFKNKEEEL